MSVGTVVSQRCISLKQGSVIRELWGNTQWESAVCPWLPTLQAKAGSQQLDLCVTHRSHSCGSGGVSEECWEKAEQAVWQLSEKSTENRAFMSQGCIKIRSLSDAFRNIFVSASHSELMLHFYLTNPNSQSVIFIFSLDVFSAWRLKHITIDAVIIRSNK